MSWIATAISGGTAIFGAISASSAAGKADAAAERRAKAELDFAKEQYQDWKNIYGGVEENLAEYYEGITPDYIETQGLQAFEVEKERAMTEIRENLSQRGLATSGIAAEAETRASLTSAEKRAQIRVEAPRIAAKQKSDFLSIGLGQKTALQAQQQNTLTNQASRSSDIAETRRGEANSAVAGATETVLDLLTGDDNPFGI